MPKSASFFELTIPLFKEWANGRFHFKWIAQSIANGATN